MTNPGLIVKPQIVLSIQDQRDELYYNYISWFLSVALQTFDLFEYRKSLLDGNFD